MPRERIMWPKRGVNAETGEQHESTFPLAHVGWFHSADGAGWVQVMLECDTQMLQDLLTDTAGREIDGKVMIYSETVDRDDANRFIRFMRKARDQAYGRDE